MAWWKDKPIGGILNTFYKEESVPYVACSLSRFWDFHPNHVLFWHSIRWSKEVAGSSVFKIYHIPPKRERVQGIDYYTFKTSFGGRLVEECTFYEKIVSPVKFKILQVLVRLMNYPYPKFLMNEIYKNMRT
jgi:lipid II:glycine glycyltransferase (peptidoglycan interpeptide bridge formation enzyme)